MLVLVSLIGFIVATIFILNMFSAADSFKRIKEPETKNAKRERVDVKKHLKRAAESDKPRLRVCPVCGTVLTSEEYLIAALDPVEREGAKRRANIYGCPHCFSTNGVNLNQENFTSIEP